MGAFSTQPASPPPPSALPLDHPSPIAPDAQSVRRLGGRWFVSDHGLEESPGSTGIGCRLMAGGGDLRESATENKPPNSWGATPAGGKGEKVR